MIPQPQPPLSPHLHACILQEVDVVKVQLVKEKKKTVQTGRTDNLQPGSEKCYDSPVEASRTLVLKHLTFS